MPTPVKSVQVRPPAQQMPSGVPVPQPVAQQAAGGVQPMMYYQQHGGQPVMMMMVPPEQAGMPSLVPQNVVQPGSQVMSVICVPEVEELPYHKRFFGSVGRAMFKHGFMQAANMMDHVPWWRG